MAIIKSTSARRTSTVKSAASKSASSKTAASKSTSSKSSGTLNSNGYRDNFDYSAAIAGTTDSAKRQQLLSERQNKIDSLGLGGKVASNDAVSTWNGTYRPYSVSSTTTGANRVSSLYDAAENARFKRFETARSRIARQLESNLASIENDYAAGMRQTDINARQSAVNNEEKLAALDDAVPGDLEKSFFYRSEILAADAVIHLANRHADLAEQMAEKCEDAARRAELLKIAEVCRHVPEHPARNFYEACQSILSYEYACYMEQNASSYNLGRLDQYLYPYYKADKEAGILTDDDAQELLDCLWIKIAEMSLFQDEVTAQYAAGYCITVQTSCGGIDEYGNDATNELSYMMIQATEDVKFKEPNLSVTYSISKNPDSLLHKAVESIGMGLTMPAVYSNDVGIRMMLNKGVPLSEAWDWNPCGCVETNLSGRLKEYTDISDINMGAMVELALNDGKSRITGEQVSVHTGDPREFKSFDDFFDAVKKHIDYAVDVVTSGNQLP